MTIQPLLDALGIQEDAARALADGLRTQIADLQNRLRGAETHLEHLAITRTTVTALADRLPEQAGAPDLPAHPDYPRILAVFSQAAGPLRARDVCEALGHGLLPKDIERTRAKLKRLVKLNILTEPEAGSARDLGVSPEGLRGWVKQAKTGQQGDPQYDIHPSMRQQIGDYLAGTYPYLG